MSNLSATTERAPMPTARETPSCTRPLMRVPHCGSVRSCPGSDEHLPSWRKTRSASVLLFPAPLPNTDPQTECVHVRSSAEPELPDQTAQQPSTALPFRLREPWPASHLSKAA